MSSTKKRIRDILWLYPIGIFIVVGIVLYNLSNEDPVTLAIHRHDTEKLAQIIENDKQVVSRKMSNGMYPLHYAVASTRTAPMRLLVDKGADVNAVLRTTENNDEADGFTPLHYAARIGDIYAVKYLVSHGADKNLKSIQGDTPFLIAKKYDRSEIAEYLR